MTPDIKWTPTQPKNSLMWDFIRFVETNYNQTFNNYHHFHQWSIYETEHFWQAIVTFFEITFFNLPSQILFHAENMIDTKWFEGATLMSPSIS